MSEQGKTFMDWIAYSLAGATIVKVLPAVAAAFSIVWIGVQLYDRIKHGPRNKG